MTPATFVPLWSSLGLRRRRWSVAAWLAVPLGILFLAVSIRLPLALHSSGVLDRVPVARASSGVNGLAGAPDDAGRGLQGRAVEGPLRGVDLDLRAGHLGLGLFQLAGGRRGIGDRLLGDLGLVGQLRRRDLLLRL